MPWLLGAHVQSPAEPAPRSTAGNRPTCPPAVRSLRGLGPSVGLGDATEDEPSSALRLVRGALFQRFEHQVPRLGRQAFGGIERREGCGPSRGSVASRRARPLDGPARSSSCAAAEGTDRSRHNR
jgi:hypothetical protein